MKTNQEKLLEYAQEALDTDVTPKDEVADEVACSQVICTLIRKVFLDFPIVASTAELFKKLKEDKRFVATLTPKRGTIVVSPRTATTFGHTGLFLTDDRIASNDSKSGLFQGNYSWSNWILTFRDKRGLRIYLFDLST